MHKLKRRRLIQGFMTSAILGLLYSLRKFWNNQDLISEINFASKDRLSILQGATSSTQTQISICFHSEQKIKVYAIDSQNTVSNPKLIENTETDFSHQFLTVVFNNLSVNESYSLIIENEMGDILDRRFFKTLDVQKREAICALISCAHDRHANIQENMWKSVEKSSPDVLFLLGDNVYVDWNEALPQSGIVDKVHLWNRYIQIRNLFYLYKMPSLIPTFAIWDDHDTGADNSYKDSPLISEATHIFNIAFPQFNIDSILKRTYGIGSHLKLFGLEILMMDSHSFRTLKTDPNPSQWGAQQEAWVESTLANSSSPIWIMNGNQFFGAYRQGKESYEWIHPSSFNDWFVKKIKASPKPVLLTSGDIHYSEIQRIEPDIAGYPLYEITSSSIHSKKKYLENKMGIPQDDVIQSNVKQRRCAVTGEFNFILVKIKTTSDDFIVEASSIGLNSTEYFNKTFLISKALET